MVANLLALSARIGLAIGALAALLAGSAPGMAIAEEVDVNRQACDNLTAEPDERIPACTRLIESGRRDVDIGRAYQVRGNVWYLKGNFDNAIADYNAATNHNPKLIEALQGLGNSYFRKAEFPSAIKAYSEALKVEKKSADLYNNRGLAQFNIGEFGSAIKDFAEAIKINPKFVRAHNNRGIAYSRYKQFESAIKDFTKAVEIEPGFVDAYMGRAEALIVEKNDLDGGIKDYDKVIGLDAKNWLAFSGRGNAFRLKGDLDRAMADHDEAIRLNPSPEAYVNRSLAWKAKGDLDHAIADLDEAILLNPNFALAYASRGEFRRLKLDLDASLGDLEKAVSLNSKLPTFLYLRGETMRDRGSLDKAIADYDEALRLVPGLAAVHTARGLAYESKGDLSKAATDFKRARELPSNVDAERTKPAQEIAKAHLEAIEAAQARDAKRAIEAKQAQLKQAQDAKQNKVPTGPLAEPAQAQRTLTDPGRRVALVIGISKYASYAVLPNAKRDAQAVAASLREVGFQSVTEEYDLDKAKLDTTLKNFARQADAANWAVIYYAGHGIEVGGINYLIPTDAKLASDRDVTFEAVPLDKVLLAAQGAKKLHLVLLDACRENPWARTMQRTASLTSRSIVSRGLTSIEPETGTMVVYAARAGEVALDGKGEHSPFAQALIDNFKKPAVEIRKLVDLVRDDVMKITDRHQLPFHYGTLPGNEDFYFRWR